VGVFVSIVSTKIPFKGTGKEYIGDDTEEIRKCVKNALQRCCKQLKQHLLTRNAARYVRRREEEKWRLEGGAMGWDSIHYCFSLDF
jgi:DNA topoisomerase VI subunit B